jgi:stress-induced-phosphoprotein 1
LACRALDCIGSTYYEQEKLEMAIKYYNKSLAEYRSPDLIEKMVEVRMIGLLGTVSVTIFSSQVEKELEELQKLQYLDSDKSLEEKEKGNDFFKKGLFCLISLLNFVPVRCRRVTTP